MNRTEFMTELEERLKTISPEERQEALQYYEDYFEDAGKDEEDRIIRELGSPENLARTIMDGLHTDRNQGQYTERGYEDTKYRDYQSMEVASGKGGNTSRKNDFQKNKSVDNTNRTLIIVLLILTLPITGGILLGFAGTLFGMLVTLVAMTGAFLIAGVALIGAGIGMMFMVQIAKGFILCGTGFIILAIACPCLVLCVWTFGRWIPALIREIVNVCRRIFGNGGIAV